MEPCSGWGESRGRSTGARGGCPRTSLHRKPERSLEGGARDGSGSTELQRVATGSAPGGEARRRRFTDPRAHPICSGKSVVDLDLGLLYTQGNEGVASGG